MCLPFVSPALLALCGLRGSNFLPVEWLQQIPARTAADEVRLQQGAPEIVVRAGATPHCLLHLPGLLSVDDTRLHKSVILHSESGNRETSRRALIEVTEPN